MRGAVQEQNLRVATADGMIARPRSRVMSRLLRGVTWACTGHVILRGFTFASTVVVARLLGVEGFGQLAMVQSSVGMFGVIAGFGLGATATKYVAQTYLTNPEKTSRILTVIGSITLISAGLLSSAVLIGADFMANNVLCNSSLIGPLRASALLFLLLTLDSVVVATLRGIESFRQLAYVNIAKGVLTPFVAIPLVMCWAVPGAMAALIITAAVGLVLSVWGALRSFDKLGVRVRATRPCIEDWSILWRFSFPTLLASVLVVPTGWFAHAILVRQTDGVSELGLFSVGNQWLTLIMFFPTVVGTVAMPIIASTRAKSGRQRRELLLRPLLATGLLGISVALVCISFSSHILQLYGPAFSHAKPVFIVMMATAVLAAMNEILFQGLLGMGAPYWRLVASFVRATVFVISMLVLIPQYLALGLAISRLLAATVYFSVQLPIYCHLANSGQKQ